MRRKSITVAVTAATLAVTTGCRTAAHSGEKTEMRHTERLAAAESAAIRRHVTLDKPVVTVEYADSPARRITMRAERIEASSDAEMRTAVRTASTDSIATAAESVKKSTPPSAGLTWLGIGAAFAAGLLCNPRRGRRDQTR